MPAKTDLQPKTILLVDDNEELREAAKDLLLAFGYKVKTASHAARAMRLFSQQPFDVLVAGLSTPGMDGVELAQRLLTRGGDLGVVLMTNGSLEPALGGRIEPNRVQGLRKPFSADELRVAVDRSLATPKAATTKAATPWSPDETGAVPGAMNLARDWATGRIRLVGSLAVAASLVLVASVVMRTSELSPPRLPERVESGVGRGAALELLKPVGELAEPPDEMAWEEITNASQYRVQIVDVDDSVLWQGLANEARMVFSGDLAQEPSFDFAAGVAYRWRVEALEAGGEVLRRSSSAPFRITPREGKARSSSSRDR